MDSDDLYTVQFRRLGTLGWTTHTRHNRPPGPLRLKAREQIRDYMAEKLRARRVRFLNLSLSSFRKVQTGGMATSLSCCVLFLGSVTQAFVCPAAATCTRPVLPQPQPIALRPTVGSRKVVPTLQAIDGNDNPPSPPPEGSFPSSAPPAPPFADGSSAPPAVPRSPGDGDQPGTSDGGLRGRFRRFRQRMGIPRLLPLVPNVAKNFWREATKNFASKAVQRQQGEELLRVSDKVNTLLLLAVPYLLLVILEGSILRVRS